MLRSTAAATLLRQGAGFIVAGLINTAASYLCYLVLLRWLDHQFAYAVAFVFGIGLSYVLNARFVFRARPTVRRTLLFPLVYVVQWAVGAALLEVLVARAGIDARLAPLFVIVVTIPLSFLLARWVLTRA
jgi:putative flippase GtrA